MLLVPREQTRTGSRAVMQLGTCPVDVAVRSSTRLPVLVPGETAQTIVEIPAVPEQVICSGDISVWNLVKRWWRVCAQTVQSSLSNS